ncbi:MAG: hypothetical protein SFY92_06950 [Verrucomicrobiae bacterium]|nr:hypothetical protein [Verrucomicrobiae bacterium]
MKLIGNFFSMLLLASAGFLLVGCETTGSATRRESAPPATSAETSAVAGEATKAEPVALGTQSPAKTEKPFEYKARPKVKKVAPVQTGKILTGQKTGRPGFVVSPYALYQEPVDCTGLASGTEVQCPHTSRVFLVP